MRHPRYCLTHHPGISFNITNATHCSTPATPTTLAHRPLYPRWCTTHTTNAGMSLQHAARIIHASTSPTLARHQCKHITNVSTPPTQARHPRHSRQYKQHTISQTPEYQIKLLKLLGLKFQEEIQQFLLLIFILTAFAFQTFLSIFIEVWKTAIEKLDFFRGNQSVLFKRRLFFQKQMRNFFRKNCFLILMSFWPFYYTIVY